MIPLTLAEVAAATGGTLTGGAEPARLVTGAVTIDSRSVGAGDLFVALPGERVDGHGYAAAALEAGAAAVLAARPVPGPAVVVADPQAALGLLARAVRDRLTGLLTIGITGSSGKTSTKDLLAAVLATAGPTVAPVGSFNNELGVPLTVLRADGGTRFLVCELGARGVGHIAYLCGIAKPDIGVVLNVGAAHAGEFGGREVTAQAKGELVEALPPAGLAVLNADDPLVAAMSARTRARVVLQGRSPHAFVRAARVRLDAQARATFDLVTPAGAAEVTLAVHGEFQVSNALAVAAVALEAGLSPEAIAAALAGATAASRWRMEISKRADGLTVVNDAYNANPDSVAAALRALVAMRGTGRTWAVLGEMLELGPQGAAEHRRVGELAAALGVDGVIAVGPGAAPIADGLLAGRIGAAEGVVVPDRDAALATIGRLAGPGDVVLIKASRGIGLERVAAALLAADTVRPGTGRSGAPHG